VKEKDVALQVGVGKPTTALKLLTELKPSLEQGRHAHVVAERNERFLNGSQWIGVGRNEQIVSAQSMPWEPMVTKNLLRPLWHTWAARILKQGATSKAYPHDATPGDIAKAYVANTILDYQRQLQDREAMNMQAALLSQAHGSVYVGTFWDRYKGKHKIKKPALDELGNELPEEVDGEEEGDVRLDLLTIMDVATDGAEHIEDAKWCLIRRWLDPFDAEERLKQAGHPGHVSPTKRPNQSQRPGQAQEVVEAWEIWHKKSARFPGGLYICIVGDAVVEATEVYPYEHGELPIACWKIQDKRDSPHGETHVNDAVPQQQRLNEVLSALARWTDIVRSMRMIAKSTVADQWDTEPDGIIRYDGDDLDKLAVFVQPPAIPKDLYELVDRYERGIAETFGVNEAVASGGTPDQTKSARQLAYISELDGQKLSIAKRNLDKFTLRVDRQTLRLWQQFTQLPRLVRIIGPERTADAEFFKGADIMGVDVWLEPSAGTERTRAASGVDAEQAAAAGYLTPDAAGERRETGLLDTMDESNVRQEVGQMAEQAMQGQPQQANPAHNPKVAISVLRGFVERSQGTPGEQPLRALLQQYTDLRDQMMAESAAPAGPQKAGTTKQPPNQNAPMGALESR
jgi:hypothetical protein